MTDGVESNLPTTAEGIAYKLLLMCMESEGRMAAGENGTPPRLSRNLILDAYADCLEAVQGKRERRTARRAA